MVKYLLLLATLVLTACQQSPETTLYQRLGGETGVEKIVDGVLYGIEHDQSIVHHFSDTDIPRFRRLLIEQFLCPEKFLFVEYSKNIQLMDELNMI